MKSAGRINVMHVALSLVVGGLERLIVEMALRMNGSNFNVEVCCFDELGHFSEYLIDRGVDVTLLKRNTKHYDVFYPYRLMKLLRKKHIHVMQMHSGTFFLATQAGVLARTPVMVYTDHGRALYDSPVRLKEDRFSGFFVNKIIAVSHELEKYLIDSVKLPPAKINTVINGINTDEFYPRPKSQTLMDEFHITDQSRVVGTVGRLDEVKDQATMLEAFALVHETIPESVLMLVGDGPKRQELSNLAAERNLSDSVIISGNRKDVPELLNLFDVFVLSSLSEGTSISLLEAMASGVPPVVTDVGGNPSVVDDRINGIVIKPKNPPLLAGVITQLLHDGGLRGQFGEAARKKVEDAYSIDTMVEHYKAIYMEQLSKNRKFSHLSYHER